MMISAWKRRPRNSVGLFRLTESPYQTRPPRLQQIRRMNLDRVKIAWKFDRKARPQEARLQPQTLQAVKKLVYDVWTEEECGSDGEPNRPAAVFQDVVEEMVVDHIALQADAEAAGQDKIHTTT